MMRRLGPIQKRLSYVTLRHVGRPDDTINSWSTKSRDLDAPLDGLVEMPFEMPVEMSVEMAGRRDERLEEFMKAESQRVSIRTYDSVRHFSARLFLMLLFLGAGLLTGCGAQGPLGGEIVQRSSTSEGGADAPSSASSAKFLNCEEARFLVLINMYRAQNGLGPLRVSKAATLASRWHAQDMGEKSYFSHTDSLGRSPWERTAQFGYSGCQGENAAAGNRDAVATFCQWKNSSGHNANMLRAQFQGIGIGQATVSPSPYGVYWSTPFGSLPTGGDLVIDEWTDERIEGGPCVRPAILPNC